MNWYEALTVREAIGAVGLDVRRDRFGPCPACGAQSEKKFRRPPCRVVSDAVWTCNVCDETRNAVGLVSLVLHGRLYGDLDREQRSDVREVFGGEAQREHITLDEPERDRHDPEVMTALMEQLRPARRARNTAVVAWLEARGLGGMDLPAWETPGSTWPGYRPGWSPIPRAWKDDYPLVVPGYDASGTLATLHGRRVAGDGPKSRWLPGGGGGWLFAEGRVALPMLRGQEVEVEGVLLVEGLPDYLSAAAAMWAAAKPWAVLGVESGSAAILALVQLPDVPLVVATHDDPAGDRYAEAIGDVLLTAHGRLPRRVLPSEI